MAWEKECVRMSRRFGAISLIPFEADVLLQAWCAWPNRECGLSFWVKFEDKEAGMKHELFAELRPKDELFTVREVPLTIDMVVALRGRSIRFNAKDLTEDIRRELCEKYSVPYQCMEHLG